LQPSRNFCDRGEGELKGLNNKLLAKEKGIKKKIWRYDIALGQISTFLYRE
jgi:hypothetical protein